jgi:WD40 repeat protein
MTRWVCGGVIVLLAASVVGVRGEGCLILRGDPRLRGIPNALGGGGVLRANQAQYLQGLAERKSPAAQPPRAPAGPAKLDRHGDPLPPGAVARYGTVRLRHGQEPIGLAFSADGKFLASISSTESGIRIWDPATGKELHRLESPVTLGALARDSSILIVNDDRCRVWIPAANVVRDLPDKTLPEGVEAVAVHPDCRSFAAGTPKKVLLIDIQTGRHLRDLNLPAEVQPTRLVYSPDGRWLAGAGQKAGVWLWDLRTGKRVRTYHAAGEFPEFAFSPDGAVIAIAGEQLQVYATDSEELVEGYSVPEGEYLCPRFSRDGKWVYAMTTDGTVVQVNAATGEVKESWVAPADDLDVPAAMASDAALAAAVDDSGAIRIWNPRTGKGPEVERLPLLREPGFSADGKTVWALAEGGRFHVFEATTGKPVKVIELPVEGAAGVFWNPASRRAAVFVGDAELELRIIDVELPKVVTKFAVPGDAGVPFIDFCAADRARVAVFCQGSVLILNPVTGRSVRTLHLGGKEDEQLSRGAISPDGRLVAVVVPGKGLSVWEVATAKKRFDLEGRVTGAGALFSPDGRHLAAWDGDGQAAVYDVRHGTVVRRLRISPPPAATGPGIAFSPDGKRIAASDSEGTLTVWNLATGDAVVALRRHEGTVTGLAFSADGTCLASTSDDGTVLVWEVPTGVAKPADVGVGGFDEAFRALGSTDPAQAQRGMDYLYRRPAEAAQECEKRIAVATATPADRIAKLVADLQNEEFLVRQAAVRDLEAIGGEVIAPLRHAAENSGDAEVRKLAADIVTRLEVRSLNADELRAARATEVLENLATPEARAVLAKWAAGPAGHRLTIEAAAALARLKTKGN